MLAIAAGLGVTSTFGTPVGGCLYSIETVVSFIAINHIWKSFVSSCLAAFCLRLLSSYLHLEVFAHKTKISETNSFGPIDIAIYISLGIFLGCLGTLFVYCLK
jgi:chloride channel 2